MSRPLRIEFPGAVYHVTSRGDRREAIYRDDVDRHNQLQLLAHAMGRFDAQALAYCQMGNHFHLVLHTRQANLSRLMRHLNGVYTQAFNRRHGQSGHLFQGRYKAILVDRDAYLLALCRYVERNPVASNLVREAAQWRWSSYRAHAGLADTPDWLDSDGLLGHLLGRPVSTSADRKRAQKRYAAMVADADEADPNFWRSAVQAQVYMGDEAFAKRMQSIAGPARGAISEIPKAQRKPPTQRSWQGWLAACDGQRSVALARAYTEGGWTMTALARELGLSVTHVGRLIAAAEQATAG
jgi:putative transposase